MPFTHIGQQLEQAKDYGKGNCQGSGRHCSSEAIGRPVSGRALAVQIFIAFRTAYAKIYIVTTVLMSWAINIQAVGT